MSVQLQTQQYRNKGGPWRRSNGEVLKHAAVFTPTREELERMELRRQIGTRFELVAPQAPAARTEPAAPVGTDSQNAGETPGADPGAQTPETSTDDSAQQPPPAKEELPPWPLQMTPELYVKIHPDGKHAPLARKLVEVAKAKTE